VRARLLDPRELSVDTVHLRRAGKRNLDITTEAMVYEVTLGRDAERTE